MVQILNNKKFRLLIASISLILLMDLIQDTYAKYITSADANSNFTIARWAFTVNNQDVVNNNDFSNTLVPVIDDNPNITSGVIAPTSTGYFEITIDSSNVGVSFDEKITLTQGENNTITDLIFTGYKVNDGELIALENTNEITTTHLLGEETTINKYKFYIKWLDGTGENMNNKNDTDASIDGVAAVKVNVNFIQKANTN